MINRQHLEENAAQVARLDKRLKDLTMEVVTIMRLDSASNGADARVDALLAYLYLEEVVAEFGGPPLLRFSELPLSAWSQRVLDDLEAILNDPNRMKAAKLAAAARLLLEDQPPIEPPRTVH